MAGKARKSKEREARKRAKKARREANQLHYQSLRDKGSNKKSKRFLTKSRRNANHEKHIHKVPFCGNNGCKKCFPTADKPHVVIQKAKAKLGLKPKQKLPSTALAKLALSAAGGGGG
jgi:hypothetical protein